MITLKQLEIFAKYHGDADMWDRIGLSSEREILKYQDWRLIEDLLQDFKIIKNATASTEYELKVKDTFEMAFDNEITKEYFISKVVNI